MDSSTDEILMAVWASLSAFHPELAARVKRARGASLTEALTVLTVAERGQGLSAELVRLVALAKQVIAGKDAEEFWRTHWQSMGLI